MRSVILCLALTSCTPWITGKVDAITTGAVNGLTSPTSQSKLETEERALINTAVDETLTPATEQKIQGIVDALASDLRAQLTTTRDAVLNDGKLTAEIDMLRETLLGATTNAEVSDLVRSTVDEALGEKTQGKVNTLIDSTSPHLQAVIGQVVDGLTPKIQGLLQSTSTTAEKDLAGLKGYFIWVIAILGLLFGIVVAIIVALSMLHKAHKQLTAEVRKL